MLCAKHLLSEESPIVEIIWGVNILWLCELRTYLSPRGDIPAGFPSIPRVIPRPITAARTPSTRPATQEIQAHCLVGGQHCSVTAKHNTKAKTDFTSEQRLVSGRLCQLTRCSWLSQCEGQGSKLQDLRCVL